MQAVSGQCLPGAFGRVSSLVSGHVTLTARYSTWYSVRILRKILYFVLGVSHPGYTDTRPDLSSIKERPDDYAQVRLFRLPDWNFQVDGTRQSISKHLPVPKVRCHPRHS
jgi:hypothetical protein